MGNRTGYNGSDLALRGYTQICARVSETKTILEGFVPMAYLDEDTMSQKSKKMNVFTVSLIFLLCSEKLKSEIFNIEFLFNTMKLGHTQSKIFLINIKRNIIWLHLMETVLLKYSQCQLIRYSSLHVVNHIYFIIISSLI